MSGICRGGLTPDHRHTMNDVDDDEKKPFEAELGGNDEDSQPDPDEHLMLDQGNGRVWMVKVQWRSSLARTNS